MFISNLVVLTLATVLFVCPECDKSDKPMAECVFASSAQFDRHNGSVHWYNPVRAMEVLKEAFPKYADFTSMPDSPQKEAHTDGGSLVGSLFSCPAAVIAFVICPIGFIWACVAQYRHIDKAAGDSMTDGQKLAATAATMAAAAAAGVAIGKKISRKR